MTQKAQVSKVWRHLVIKSIREKDVHDSAK